VLRRSEDQLAIARPRPDAKRSSAEVGRRSAGHLAARFAGKSGKSTAADAGEGRCRRNNISMPAATCRRHAALRLVAIGGGGA